MKLNLKVPWLKKLKKDGGVNLEETYRWHNDDNWCEIEMELLGDKDLTFLLAIVRESKEKGARAVVQKINLYNKLKADLTGTVINNLQGLEMALRQYIMPSAHKWLFEEHEDGQVVPWYVRIVKYHPPDEREGSTAYVELSAVASRCNEKVDRTLTWNMADLGKSVVAILTSDGVYLETPEAVQTYEAQLEHYKAIHSLTGEQFLAYGSAFEQGSYRYYRSDMTSMERDGEPARVVMDDVTSDEGKTVLIKTIGVSTSYWVDIKEGLEDSDHSVVAAPIQPYVTVFDLVKHVFVRIHTSNLKAYEYNPSLIDKLILPQERKDLISILVAGADLQLEDIVKGKTGGIEVICTGPPGTGKTLTAEVFSELMRRPLYCVQCSQLGTDEGSLEKELNIVLGRAARWKAILLIDEADVYIHERGDDIQQNAIVGVWLRLMEHYRGVMFMTSNRDTIIDDAIMSRATAWIRYEYPDDTARAEIWSVLSENYGVALTLKEILELGVLFPKISGRTIKNLLRLSRLLAERKKIKVDVALIKYVSGFIDLDVKTKVKLSAASALASRNYQS